MGVDGVWSWTDPSILRSRVASILVRNFGGCREDFMRYAAVNGYEYCGVSGWLSKR